MLKGIVSACLCLSGLVVLSGCGAGAGGDFASNDLAVQTLANKTWGDPSGETRLTFNADAKLVDLVVPDLPAEYAGLKIDGTPFKVTLPNDPNLMQFAGQSVNLSVENSKTTLDANGNLTMEFTGTADVPLVDHIALVLNGNMANNDLSNLSGRLEVYVPFVGKVFEQSIDNVIGDIPIAQL